MNKKQWIKKKKKRRANADIISKLQFSIRSFLKLFTNICPKAHISKTLYNVIFTTLFNKIFICASVGSVFIGISKHLVKKKKTVPADEPLPTAISFFNFRLHLSVNPNWFSNTPTLILCSPESVFEYPYLDPL